MKLRKTNIKVGVYIVAILSLLPNYAIPHHQEQPGIYGVGGYAVNVGRHGSFNIENRFFEMGSVVDRFRLWGVLPNADILHQIIANKRIICTQFGSSHMQLAEPISVVQCNIYPEPDDYESENINRYLVETGQGIEICAETLGRYGTCRKDN